MALKMSFDNKIILNIKNYVLNSNKIKSKKTIFLFLFIFIFFTSLFINKVINKSDLDFGENLAFDDPIYINKDDFYRFIAHAGGEIDGKIYTNSLEAINNSYKNGFKLFELDLIKSSDGKYVAAHDWEYWAKITNYKGELPPTEDVFLNTPIHSKYTPLNFNRINEWFKDKNDAYLITDKTNEPEVISDLFYDKNKLMMELFSIEALNTAYNLKIGGVLANAEFWITLTSLEKKKSMDKFDFFVVNAKLDKTKIIEMHNAGKKIYFHNYDEKILYCTKNNIAYGFYAKDTLVKKSQC